LRQRKSDIGILLEHFLAEAAADLGKSKPTVPKELPILLVNYDFPGNVRELRALTYEAMSQHHSKMLSMEVFRRVLSKDITNLSVDTSTSTGLFNAEQPLPKLQELAALLVKEAMNRAQGNQSLASQLLVISQPALSKRLKKALPH
jgi:transcriptional regulator with PAS, ATPase and Fis domain